MAYHNKQNVTCWRLETCQVCQTLRNNGVPKPQTQNVYYRFWGQLTYHKQKSIRKWHPLASKNRCGRIFPYFSRPTEICRHRGEAGEECHGRQGHSAFDVAVWQSWLGIRPQPQPKARHLIKTYETTVDGWNPAHSGTICV